MKRKLRKSLSWLLTVAMIFSLFCGMIPTASAASSTLTVGEYGTLEYKMPSGDGYAFQVAIEVDDQVVCTSKQIRINGDAHTAYFNFDGSKYHVLGSEISGDLASKGDASVVGAGKYEIQGLAISAPLNRDEVRTLTIQLESNASQEQEVAQYITVSNTDGPATKATTGWIKVALYVDDEFKGYQTYNSTSSQGNQDLDITIGIQESYLNKYHLESLRNIEGSGGNPVTYNDEGTAGTVQHWTLNRNDWGELRVDLYSNCPCGLSTCECPGGPECNCEIGCTGVECGCNPEADYYLVTFDDDESNTPTLTGAESEYISISANRTVADNGIDGSVVVWLDGEQKESIPVQMKSTTQTLTISTKSGYTYGYALYSEKSTILTAVTNNTISQHSVYEGFVLNI